MFSEFPGVQMVKNTARAMKASALQGACLASVMGLNGAAVATRFRGLCVAVVGCGSVGGRIVLALSRLGVGRLILVDPKRYKPASVATQPIGPEAVGRHKVEVLSRQCKAIHPRSQVLRFAGAIEALAPTIFTGVDVVVMAPDRLEVELTVGQWCLWMGKPLFHAAVHGATLTAQVRCFDNARADGGCPRCGFGQQEFDLMARQARFSCEGGPDGRSAAGEAGTTNALCCVSSLAADLAVVQIARHVLSLGEPVGNTMVEYCGFTHRTLVSPLRRNPQCPLDHKRWALVAVPAPLGGWSLAGLAERATGGALAETAQFQLPAYDWVERASCGCSQPRVVRRFVPRGGKRVSRCRGCGEWLRPQRFFTHQAVGLSVLGSAVRQPLRRLGLKRGRHVVLRVGEAGYLISAADKSERSI